MEFIWTRPFQSADRSANHLGAATLLLSLLLIGCGRSSFLNGQPAAPKNTTPSLKVSDVQISQGNVADGVTPAEVTVTLKNDQGEPIVGAPMTLTVSGSDNVVVPCTNTDVHGIARCRVYSTKAETKTFTFNGSMFAVKDVDFFTQRPQRAAFSFVGSAAVDQLPSGHKIISSSGLVEGPVTMRDSNGVIRVYTSIHGAMLGN